MCLSVHVASDAELPVGVWNPEARAFFLEGVPVAAGVRERFSLPNVYFAGTHLGCGCGFIRYENDDQADKTQTNYEALAGTIRAALASGSNVEVFTCWEGDHDCEPEWLETISVSDLLLPDFELQERQFLRVRA